MIHPARHVVRALLLTEVTPTQEAINRRLAQWNSPPLEDAEFDHLVREVEHPFPIDLSGLDRRTNEWLTGLGCSGAVFRDDLFRQAERIMQYPELQERIRRLLMARLSYATISSSINAPILTEAVVAEYAHNWWCVEGISLQEWDSLLARMPAPTTAHPLHASLTMGHTVAQGYARTLRAESAEAVLQELLAMNVTLAREIAEMPPSKEKAFMLRSVTSNVVRLNGELSQTDNAAKKSQKQFGRFRARFTQDTPPTLAGLVTTGSVSTSKKEKKG